MPDLDAVIRFLLGALVFAVVGYILIVAPRDDSIRWYRRPTPITLRAVAMAFAALLLIYIVFALIRP
jgi:hypothetical protein